MTSQETGQGAGEVPVISFPELIRQRELNALGTPGREALEKEISKAINSSPFGKFQNDLYDLQDMVPFTSPRIIINRLQSLRADLRTAAAQEKDLSVVFMGEELLARSQVLWNGLLPRAGKAITDAVPDQTEGKGRRTVTIPEFKSEKKEEAEKKVERDEKRVDWIREKLCKIEVKKRSLSWIERRQFEYVVGSIEVEETRDLFNSEIHLRQEMMGLLQQWESVNGSEKAIGQLLFEPRKQLLRVEQLIEIAHLLSAKEGEGRVSLSVQVSRAMSLYLNFLGAWAEGYKGALNEEKRAWRESEEKGVKDREKYIKDEVKKYCMRQHLDTKEKPGVIKPGVIKRAEKKIGEIAATKEGEIPHIDSEGKVEVSFVSKILEAFPKELEKYKPREALKIRLGEITDGKIGLAEVFGFSFFTGHSLNGEPKAVTAQDILWVRSVIAGLSGSKDAEILALTLLDFTGETDFLNTTWGNGYRETDFQKFLKLEERRRREALNNYPHGPEASMNKYPEVSGNGWLENARVSVEIYGDKVKDTDGNVRTEYLKNGEPREVPVKWVLTGWENEIPGLKGFEPKAFHEVDWNFLARDTYTLDFLLKNLRYYTVFSNATTKNLKLDEQFSSEGLETMYKALENAFGPKFKEDGSGPSDIPEKSPWVWYAIGYLSMHNPEKDKILPGMKMAPPENEMLVYELSAEEKYERAKRPTYNENFRMPLLVSGFLTEGEMVYVEKYCKISRKFAGFRF